MRDTARDSNHLDDVLVALRTERVDVDRLVGQCQRVEGGVEVPDRCVKVDRFNRISAKEMHRIEHLPEPEQVLVVGAISDAPTTVSVVNVWCACHRAVRDPIAADLERSVGVGGVERELGRGRRHRGHDGIAANADSFALNGRPRRLQDGSSLRVQHIHPDVLKDFQRREVNVFKFVGGHHFGGCVSQPWLGARALLGKAATRLTAPFGTAASASRHF